MLCELGGACLVVGGGMRGGGVGRREARLATGHVQVGVGAEVRG